jgi:hypothetical protein
MFFPAGIFESGLEAIFPSKAVGELINALTNKEQYDKRLAGEVEPESESEEEKESETDQGRTSIALTSGLSKFLETQLRDQTWINKTMEKASLLRREAEWLICAKMSNHVLKERFITPVRQVNAYVK